MLQEIAKNNYHAKFDSQMKKKVNKQCLLHTATQKGSVKKLSFGKG